MMSRSMRAATAATAALLALVLGACSGSRAPEAVSGDQARAVPPSSTPPDRSQLPPPGPPAPWAPPAPDVWQLPNGMRVYYAQHVSVPLVSVALVFPHGSETDPPGKAGLTQLMADLMDEGAGSLGALALNERLRGLATDYWAQVGVDSIVLGMHLIEENFAPSIEVLADIVRRPHFDEREFELRKSLLIAQAIASVAEPRTGRRAAMYRGLFGDGYAGALPSGTRETLAKLTLAEVKAQHAAAIASKGAAFVVVGGIERESVRRELERAFQDWAGAPRVEPRTLEADASAGKLYFVDYPGAAQSVIGVVRRAPGADAPDLFPSSIFNRAFGEAFTSRVNLNLREEKGFTYGAVSMFQRFRRTGFFGVFSDVRTDVTRQSLDEVLRELAEVCGARPLTLEERNDAVNGELLGYPGDFESIGEVSARFSQIPIHDRPLDWFTLWPSRIAAVTLEQTNAAAQSYCKPSEFALVVAGDKTKVLPTLDGIGYELVSMNARGERL